MRVCQFRHDGKWTSIVATAQGRRIRKTCMSILQPGCSLSNHLPHAKSIDICTRCHLYAVSSVRDVILRRAIALRGTLRSDCSGNTVARIASAGCTVRSPPATSKLSAHVRSSRGFAAVQDDISHRAPAIKQPYSSFAFIVIFALSTFETGHPFSAASAYFWNVAASAPGTLPTTSM